VPADETDLRRMLHNDRFPLSTKYDPHWVVENQMGPSALWLTEWLCERMELRLGMRVLDMGCGKAMSSVFLAKEFGVQVWANDLWISATDNWKRIREAGVEDRVFPIHAEAHALPYAEEFFDAIVCIDSYTYYGTDDVCLASFVKLVKRGGRIGIVVPALMRDFEDGEVPAHLTRRQSSGGTFWDSSHCFSFHTAEWWRRHWHHTGLVGVEVADVLDDGWRHWLQWDRAIMAAGANHFPSDAEALEADQGRYIGFVRMVARRRATLTTSCDGGNGHEPD
jgi:cyclopropane fatty-acyl-phospholipid synthase-like methyltransferase